MKFWIDENISSYIVNKLKQHGHEIYKAKRGTDDFSILQYAIEEEAIIITYDQDFERLVLKDGNACNGIIWIRLDNPNRLEEMTAKLVRLVKFHEKKLATSFITLSLDGMYIKKLKEEGIAYDTSSYEYPMEHSPFWDLATINDGGSG
ncbi:MAG TPA: DUF5615 family PIN-like protein [Ktedonobacteraceae bacterium]|nr:DUF5615 family PIN-like protein [Ktedonobacteraceae bacterium]